MNDRQSRNGSAMLCGRGVPKPMPIVSLNKKFLFVVRLKLPNMIRCTLSSRSYVLRIQGSCASLAQIWKVPHVFYQGTLSSSSETNLYFLSSDIELLLDYMLDQYPTLDRRLLSPGPEKLVQSHMFSSPPHPISFSTVEALQANRQGSKLTHNSALLADNKKIYADFAEKGNGAVLAVDIESWERDHSVILEFGWSYISWSRDEQGNVKEQRKSEHLSECNIIDLYFTFFFNWVFLLNADQLPPTTWNTKMGNIRRTTSKCVLFT